MSGYSPCPAADRPPTGLRPVPPLNYVEDWKGDLFWKAVDPTGYKCLYLILLERRKPEDIKLIFSELKDQICPLMLDRFGWNVIICLCQVCDEQQLNGLVSSLTADVDLLLAVCLNSQGSEAMGKLLDCLRTPKQMSDVIHALQPLMARLVRHKFGCRVIRQFFRIFPDPAKETQPIIDAIAGIFFEMATDDHGFFLLGELLQSKVFLLDSRPGILSKIIEDVHQLAHHPFAAYVVRNVIRLRMKDVERDITAKLRGHFALMSMHKHAQCVVLALMEESKGELEPQIFNEMISSPNFFKLQRDPFWQICSGTHFWTSH